MPGVGRGCIPGAIPIPPPVQGRPTKTLSPPSPQQGFDLPRIRPIFRLLNQSRAHGIHPHVIPFFRIAFAAAQQMVEKSFLPSRAQLFRFASPARCRPGLHPRRGFDPAARVGAAYKNHETTWSDWIPMPGVGRGCIPGAVPIPPPVQGRPTQTLSPPSPPQGFDFSCERPIFRLLNQSRAHGIHPHVIPFFRIAFAAAQQMV